MKRYLVIFISLMVLPYFIFAQKNEKIYRNNISLLTCTPLVCNSLQGTQILIEKYSNFHMDFEEIVIENDRNVAYYSYEGNRILWDVNIFDATLTLYFYDSNNLLYKDESYSLKSTLLLNVVKSISAMSSLKKQKIRQYNYNAQRQVTSIVSIHPNGNKRIETYKYDNKGRLSAVLEDGETIREYRYDETDKLTRETEISRTSYKDQTGIYRGGKQYFYKGGQIVESCKTSQATLWGKITHIRASKSSTLLADMIGKSFPITSEGALGELIANRVLIGEVDIDYKMVVTRKNNEPETKEEFVTYEYEINSHGNWETRYTRSSTDGKIQKIAKREYRSLSSVQQEIQEQEREKLAVIERKAREDSIRQARQDSIKQARIREDSISLARQKHISDSIRLAKSIQSIQRAALLELVKNIENGDKELQQLYSNRNILVEGFRNSDGSLVRAKNKLYKVYNAIYQASEVCRRNARNKNFAGVIDEKFLRDVQIIQQNMRKFRKAKTKLVEKKLDNMDSLEDKIEFLKKEALTLLPSE
jgi:hypothetical protein